MTNAMKVNMNNNTIIITSAFAKKAEIFGTPEFRQLMEAKRELKEYTDKEFTVEIVKKAKKSASLDEPKEKKIRPSYKMMSDFIKAIDDEKGTQLEAFKKQRDMVRFGTTKYNGTLAWFLNEYANNDKYAGSFKSFYEMVEATKSEEESTEENNTVEFKQATNY